jgi:hypothetical protein
MSAPEISTPSDLDQRARRTAERSQQYLLSVQDGEGWWKGDLDTNVISFSDLAKTQLVLLFALRRLLQGYRDSRTKLTSWRIV